MLWLDDRMKDWRLSTTNAALVVIDPQEKLMAAMPRRAEVLPSIHKLTQACRLLEIPALLTLQYVKGLGPVCSELNDASNGLPTFEKLSFSCCGSGDFARAIKELRRPRIIVCGIETHVCVLQTVIDLMALDCFVYVCADAVCSRRDVDHQTALERLRDCGAVITTVESALFEILKEAGRESFKKVLPLLK
jgi:nicotinamidase-related amidase